MRAAAKQGLQLYAEGNDAGTPRALEVGKKIASGQDLSDDHILDMAHYHSSHDSCPKDCEDLLWGGPAGDMWSKNNLIKNMQSNLSDNLETLVNNKTDLSFEIFTPDFNLDEPVSLGEDDDGLIWAPIVRSGMLATRPGPNGEKLNKPLIFVSGNSKDQLKEIGLQDIVDAFNDEAVEYVTIPIDIINEGKTVSAHNNALIQNTGLIKGLKIADSKKIPGEKIILAAHNITEPDFKGKIERGTIPSRSCGLLHDYKNTTTGKIYPIVLEHVALTSKPWVGGMEPYGAKEFSDRTVVPMFLSEKSFSVEKEEEKTVPTKLAQETNNEPTKLVDKALKSEFLADIQWGDDVSQGNIESQINNILSTMCGGDDDQFPIYYLLDRTNDKALIKVNYGIGNDNDAWVAPYSVEGNKVNLAPFSDWVDVEQKWVSDTVDPKQDREQLDKLKMSDDKTDLAVLSSKERKKLPTSDFVYPDEKKYPIHDIAHGRNALARVAQNGTPEEQAKVRSAVYRKYPELKQNKEKSNMSELQIASARRKNHEPPGGHMKLLPLSEEKMELMGLSDEAKEFQRKQNVKIEKLNTELAEKTKEEKKTRVEKRIADLSEDNFFKEHAGLLKEIEDTYLSDDGDVALELKLSDHGHDVKIPETATQIVDRIIKALPRNKDNKVSFGEPSKLTSPLSGRPELEPVDPNASNKPKNGKELAEQMLAADPTLADEPMIKLAIGADNGKGQ